jgi:hypothetical protein
LRLRVRKAHWVTLPKTKRLIPILVQEPTAIPRPVRITVKPRNTH